MAMITSRPEKISVASPPVISTWARRCLVPKKKVKPMVTTAPTNRVNQMTPGTTPSATTIRARRAWVNVSTWRSASASTAGLRAPTGSCRSSAR